MRSRYATIAVTVIILSCCGAQPFAPVPTLPEASTIPDGIYSETIEMSLTIREGGAVNTETDARQFTIVADEGHLLDAGGNAFRIG